MPNSETQADDRLVLGVEVVENTRDEDVDDFERILTTAFSGAYDEIEIDVTHE